MTQMTIRKWYLVMPAMLDTASLLKEAYMAPVRGLWLLIWQMRSFFPNQERGSEIVHIHKEWITSAHSFATGLISLLVLYYDVF